MNLCFLMGEIIDNVKFDFVYDSNYVSIVKFKLKLKNKSVVIVKGYDEIADYCFANLKKSSHVFVEGRLNNKCEVIIRFNSRFIMNFYKIS